MRNGDLYKMQAMLKHGATREEVHDRFKWDYTPDHIDKFLPKKRKRKVKTNVGSGDMQPSPAESGAEQDHVANAGD